MSVKLQLAAALTISALSFGLGSQIERGFDLGDEAPVVHRPQPFAPAQWRLALDDLRQTADAGTMRAQALEVLNTADSVSTLSEAIRLLGWVADDSDIELLHSLALSREPELSFPAIAALGHLGTGSAVNTLLQLRSRGDLESAILQSLGASGHWRAFQELERELASSSEGENRASAAQAMATFGTPQAAQALIASLDEKPVDEIAHALAQFTEDVPEARQALYRMLRHGDSEEREAALFALARADDPGIYEVLAHAARSGTPQNRWDATMAMAGLSDPRAIPFLRDLALNGDRQLRSAASSALAQLPYGEATDALLDVVELGSSSAALEAVYQLSDVTDGRTLSVLLWALENRSRDIGAAIRNRLYSEPWGRAKVPKEILEIARQDLAF
ncbi:MAG: HEAT repeat domain-containing protein, partial [Proteobacteria bacterium]|nr:HEAT repeat domain-containing protein [Pseudomonadota bacterium]